MAEGTLSQAIQSDAHILEDEPAPLIDTVGGSIELIFSSRLTWLIAMGPVAIFGDATGLLGESLCFICAGVAMIPCAERLSFVTEQVAEHTNGTIGALLNATFGNAPELLISVSALRARLFRVVQLALLGSILTNMLLVFGISCMIGGLRYQVQYVRPVTGSVHSGMLWLGTTATLVPLALAFNRSTSEDASESAFMAKLSRLEAVIMLVLYVLYLFFQLATHKEEFDNEIETTSKMITRRNLVCRQVIERARGILRLPSNNSNHLETTVPFKRKLTLQTNNLSDLPSPPYTEDEQHALIFNNSSVTSLDEEAVPGQPVSPIGQHRRRRLRPPPSPHIVPIPFSIEATEKSRNSNVMNPDDMDFSGRSFGLEDSFHENSSHFHGHSVAGPQISLRVGILWLFIITLCISAMSDILVDTIDSFSRKLHLSSVFVSMVVIPFFSNVAEQVSAFLFAYRNEMDLVVGVTVGSAIQIANMVLPGTVLLGALMDCPMTLYLGTFETFSLVIGVIAITAVLHGGTTNWFAGAVLVGIYGMIAAGIWCMDDNGITPEQSSTLNNTALVADGGS